MASVGSIFVGPAASAAVEVSSPSAEVSSGSFFCGGGVASITNLSSSIFIFIYGERERENSPTRVFLVAASCWGALVGAYFKPFRSFSSMLL